MDWTELGKAGLGAAGSIFGGAGGEASAPSVTTADSGPVTVSVGGLNVPAYPNFPRMQMNGGQVVSRPDAVQAVASDGRFYLLAGAVVLAVFLSRVLK